MPVYTSRTGLLVAEETRSEQTIQHALEQLDPRLVLAKELDRRGGGFVWQVLVLVGSDTPAVHVCDWRENGRPLPLSHGLVERVREQLARGEAGLTLADRLNERLVARVDRDIDHVVDETAQDLTKINGARSAVLPRGQHLRRSRDKQRSRGERV